MLNSSFAYQPRFSTTAPMPQPPTLQHFLSPAQNTTHQSVFCWTHGSRVETQQEHSPSPVSMNHPGWGFLLAQPAESFSLIHFLCSLSLYRTDFPGSKFPHNTRKPIRPLQLSVCIPCSSGSILCQGQDQSPLTKLMMSPRSFSVARAGASSSRARNRQAGSTLAMVG